MVCYAAELVVYHGNNLSKGFIHMRVVTQPCFCGSAILIVFCWAHGLVNHVHAQDASPAAKRAYLQELKRTGGNHEMALEAGYRVMAEEWSEAVRQGRAPQIPQAAASVPSTDKKVTIAGMPNSHFSAGLRKLRLLKRPRPTTAEANQESATSLIDYLVTRPDPEPYEAALNHLTETLEPLIQANDSTALSRAVAQTPRKYIAIYIDVFSNCRGGERPAVLEGIDMSLSEEVCYCLEVYEKSRAGTK